MNQPPSLLTGDLKTSRLPQLGQAVSIGTLGDGTIRSAGR